MAGRMSDDSTTPPKMHYTSIVVTVPSGYAKLGMCPMCGALVADAAKHDRFHNAPPNDEASADMVTV